MKTEIMAKRQSSLLELVSTLVILMTIFQVDPVTCQWYAHEYWNSRYDGRDGYSPYSTVETGNGMWSDQGSLRAPYMLDSSLYSGEDCTGCVCEDSTVTQCTSDVLLKNQPMQELTNHSFPGASAITSVTILECSSLADIGGEDMDAFSQLTSLTTLIIQYTSIKDFPEVSATNLEILNLAGNVIEFSIATWRNQVFPASLTHVALMNNQIRWVPPGLFSNSNIQYLSLSNNQITSFPYKALEGMTSLLYLGLDGNQISTIAYSQLAVLTGNPLQHLNISNNNIRFIERLALSQLTSLVILEAHNNHLASLPAQTFHNIPALLHLDLNYNYLNRLSELALSDLPKLVTLRLHSQQNGGLQVIEYNAFQNINQSLEYLWISDNNLDTFAHQVLSEEFYDVIDTLWADNNNITSVRMFGQEAFPTRMTQYYEAKNSSFLPFETIYRMKILHLETNQISSLGDLDLCASPDPCHLEELYLDENLLSEDTIHSEAFKSQPNLRILSLNQNLIQYIPEAVKYNESTPALVELRMTNNYLTFVPQGAFTDLQTLQIIDLSYNSIISVEDGSFPVSSLSEIHLGHNSFRFLHQHQFGELVGLSHLDLQFNDITIIPDSAFHNMSNLSTVLLNNNNIKRILKTHFKDNPLSGDVALNDNDIAFIEDGTFSHVTEINSISLDNNFLTALPYGGDFQNMEMAGSFSADGNYITSIQQGTFYNFSCTSVSLVNNKISRVHTEAFVNVETQKDVYLTDNPLRTLDSQAFKSLKHRHLYLNGLNLGTLVSQSFFDVSAEDVHLESSNIQAIEEDAFSGIQLSGSLYLNNNGLQSVSGTIFSNGSTISEWLYLNDNSLTSLPVGALNDLTVNKVNLDNNNFLVYPGKALTGLKVTELYIRSNQIAEVAVGSFSSTNIDIQILDLSSNQIAVIPEDVFSELTNLQELYLHDNSLKQVQHGAFRDLVSLKKLHLQNNDLNYLPALTELPALKIIQLQNNDIENLASEAFASASQLEEVYLQNNQLSCDCELYHTMSVSKDAIQSAECSSPTNPNQAGYQFNIDNEDDSNYFLNGFTNYFMCTGQNVTVSAPGDYQLQVSFSAPAYLFPAGRVSGTEGPQYRDPGDTTPWVYTVKCTSEAAATLEDTVSDNSGGVTMTDVTVLFEQSDGVEPGVEYSCRVNLEVDGDNSGWSYPVSITTVTVLDVSGSAGPNDFVLDVTYRDFSVTHDDFTGYADNEYTDVVYMPSPYGGWLTDQASPLSSSMSEWYRRKPGTTGIEVTGNIILTYSNSDAHNRFWSSSFFPLDTLGYSHENQKDCTSVLHNFGFTSAIKGGLVYEGTGTVSIGGGDQIWLAVNKTILTEMLFDPDNDTLTCVKVDLTPAANGGGWIVPVKGIINTVTSTCDATESLTDAKVWLQLETGFTYHFEVFHVERRPCKSSLFLDTVGISFYQLGGIDFPPMDYFAYPTEDLHLHAIIAELDLSDSFSTGPSFDVSILQGNEARHFTVKEDTSVIRSDAEPPASANYTYTALDGVDVLFVECSSVSVASVELNVSGVESFTVSTETALLIVNSSLDYEVEDFYVLILQVVDTAASPPQTGTIVIRIAVSDVNDNCPIISPSNFSFAPIPALQTGSVLTVTAQDADSGNNGDVYFVAAIPRPDSSILQYNDSMDYWIDVSGNKTELIIQIAALDRGVNPTRGSVSEIRVTLSNTCLLSVLFETIETEAEVNSSTGEVYLRVPGHYVEDFACQNIIGLSSGHVIDSQITASSSQSDSTLPARARLNNTFDNIGLFAGGWVAGTYDSLQWLQVDMLEPYKYQGIQIQGREDVEMWVETFSLLHSADGVSFTEYSDENNNTIFQGSRDQDTIVSVTLSPPILNRYIRINPLTWHIGISLRLELIGCSQAQQYFYDSGCQRCEAGYFCTGDGLHRPCGWCDPDIEPGECEKNPTEHSFGAFSQCVECPAGWVCDSGLANPCPLYHYAECNSTSCIANCTPCEAGSACLGGIKTKCGPGTYGDGMTESCVLCSPGTFQNVSLQTACMDCPAGYSSASAQSTCVPCPRGTFSTGGGSLCNPCPDSLSCACEASSFPCFGANTSRPVECLNLADDGVSYSCEECPPGFTGDGVTCHDIDECTDHDPCFNGSCINTTPGYQCKQCPRGYTGHFRDGITIGMKERLFSCDGGTSDVIVQQTCDDIDECENMENIRCDVNSACINTMGSYTCGACKKGYLGDGYNGCYDDNYCESDRHTCSDVATCYYTGPATYRCECPDGYVGTGEECGKDSDLDGHPDNSLSTCLGFGCQLDNCPEVPNSGQEDWDTDRDGDSCDSDDDNDAVLDEMDNCQFTHNSYQLDSDSDGVGDECDNCVIDFNSDQTDTDGDGQGDECDSDDDADGITDSTDNCPLVANSDQQNSDGDSHGDVCDNCPQTDNENQADIDHNGFGDACETGDRDGDGIPDEMDNCVYIPNSPQTDIDQDDIGDACDTDIDGDGIDNLHDNCIYVNNSGQEDSDGNQLGDACGTDSDGDGVHNNEDYCPHNPTLHDTSFQPYTVIAMDPDNTVLNDTAFSTYNSGKEVVYRGFNSSVPLLLIGNQHYSDVDFSGTWYVSSEEGDDYLGFVFGYQSNRKFYVAMMRRENKNYGDNYRGGITGLQIKAVHSSSGPGTALTDALWHSDDTDSEVTMLWQDPSLYTWKPRTPIRWNLKWRPSIGLINIRVHNGEGVDVISSGDIYDYSILGGKLGVFVFNQSDVTWSNLIVRCQEGQNSAVYLDGVSYLELANMSAYQIDQSSFSFGLWVKWNDTLPMDKQPLLCTLAEEVCLSVENQILVAKLGGTRANGSTILVEDTWYHIMMRYEYETETVTVYLNGSSGETEAIQTDATHLSNLTENNLYVGRNNNSYFSGFVDEIRIYNRWIPEEYMDEIIQYRYPVWPLHQHYLTGYYNMDSYNEATHTVYDNGPYSLHGILHGAVSMTKTDTTSAFFEMVFPDN